MTTLQIRLLGNFAIIYQDAPLRAFTSPRRQSFLAYLLLHCRTPQTRQQVAFHLWPDSTEAQAHSNLRKAIHHLRCALPECNSILHIDNRSVHWRPQIACMVDVDEFVARRQAADQPGATNPATRQTLLAEAVTFYQGDLLPGCYDEWLIPARERLRQQLLETLEQIAWVSEDRRDYATAIHYANHRLRVEPLSESTYQQLMRLHALTGDRAAALQTYHTCVAVLQRELGVGPGAAIEAAYTQLLAAVIPAGFRPTSSSAPAGVIRLVGRQPEWQRLRTLWQQTLHGQTNFCLLQGEAGIGKTRLAEEIRDWVARQGVITATSRSYAAEGALAYAPVVEWLRSPPLQTALATLAELWLTEVARLLPELLVERPTLPRPAPLTAQWQRQRLFEALARAFTSDGQPKLLLIDDLQWCDGETLAWLRYLHRFTHNNGHLHRPAPLLILGTARSEEIDDAHPLITLLLDLRRNDEITELTLTPLNATETAELAAQLTATPLLAEAAQTIYRQSEGNPLFVVEMVRSEIEDARTGDGPSIANRRSLPPKVQSVIQLRLNQLSPAARQLLGLAATIGRSFSFALLQQASSHPEDELVQRLDELWQRGLVREQGLHTYDFSHDRIREAAYALVGPVQRPLWHKRVAQALETLHANDRDTVSAQMAVHYAQAGLVKEAIAYYQRAAAVAVARFDHTDAIELLDTALHLLETQAHLAAGTQLTVDLLLAKADSLRVVEGLVGTKISKVYQQIEMIVAQVDDERTHFWAMHALRVFHGLSGQTEKAHRQAKEVFALAYKLEELEFLRSAHHGLAFVNLQLGHFALAKQYAMQAEAIGQRRLNAQRIDSQALLSSRVMVHLDYLGLTLWLLGYPQQALTKIREALAEVQTLSDYLQVSTTLFFASLVYSYLRSADLAITPVEQMLMLDDRYKIPINRVAGLVALGWLLAHQGKLTEGITEMRTGIDKMNAMNHMMFQTHRLAWLVEAQMQAEDWEATGKTLDEAFAMSDQSGQRSADAELYRLRGEWLLQSAGANPTPPVQAAAEAAFQQALTVARTQEAKSFELRAATSLCRLWQKQGKQTEAYALLAAVYSWFTEGFDTADLQDAKALLTALC